MRPSLFRDVMQGRTTVCYQRAGRTCLSYFQGQAFQAEGLFVIYDGGTSQMTNGYLLLIVQFVGINAACEVCCAGCGQH
jgi:hypothetical protein